MSTYIVTGGVHGIGKATVDVLREQNHTVYCIDNEGGDITADLGKPEGRQYAIDRVHELCPDGIDGLACIAGVSMPKPTNSSVLSINYFGAVAVAEGLFDLLQMRKGSCVITTSGSVTWADRIEAPSVAWLLTDCGDEERISRLVNTLPNGMQYNMYFTSKIALLRWVRRNSAEWAMRGVRLNAIGPGCVDTRLSVAPAGADVNESFHQTIPMHYSDLSLMDPRELANAFAFLLSNKSAGIAGNVMWVDAGQESYYYSERIH